MPSQRRRILVSGACQGRRAPPAGEALGSLAVRDGPDSKPGTAGSRVAGASLTAPLWPSTCPEPDSSAVTGPLQPGGHGTLPGAGTYALLAATVPPSTATGNCTGTACRSRSPPWYSRSAAPANAPTGPRSPELQTSWADCQRAIRDGNHRRVDVVLWAIHLSGQPTAATRKVSQRASETERPDDNR